MHTLEKMRYRGYEFSIEPPLEFADAMISNSVDDVVLAYLVQEYGMTEAELSGVAYHLADTLDRCGIASPETDINDSRIYDRLGQASQCIAGWLPGRVIEVVL